MAKGSSKKVITPMRSFSVGVIVGIMLFWIPLERDFKPITLRTDTETRALSSFPLPLTTPIIHHKGFTIAYDGKTRNPSWVYRELTPTIFDKNAYRSECSFKEDPEVPLQIRATPKDYEGSGFDRGHLAPASDHSSTQEELQETFYLSNITPQVPELNRGYWKKLENHLRLLVKQHDKLHVFTGPLYLAGKTRAQHTYVKYEVIGKNQVAVPTHFFVLIFIESSFQKILAKGYILPNKAIPSDVPLEKFAASIEEVEKASGIIFTQ